MPAVFHELERFEGSRFIGFETIFKRGESGISVVFPLHQRYPHFVGKVFFEEVPVYFGSSNHENRIFVLFFQKRERLLWSGYPKRPGMPRSGA